MIALLTAFNSFFGASNAFAATSAFEAFPVVAPTAVVVNTDVYSL